MKKSTILVSIALVGVVITVTAGNLMLKHEYTNGKIVSNQLKINLSPFKYIKETITERNNNQSSFTISTDKQKETYIWMGIEEKDIFSFTVRKDTLFIQNNPKNILHKKLYRMNINNGSLLGIDALNGIYEVEKPTVDSLSLIAKESAVINLNTQKIKSLKISASGTSEINLYSRNANDSLPGVIGYALIEMRDYSNLSSKNIVIGQKSISLENGTSLKLSGTSINDFGIRQPVKH